MIPFVQSTRRLALLGGKTEEHSNLIGNGSQRAPPAALTRHPRFHIHYTVTSSSWLNMVERFLGASLKTDYDLVFITMQE